MLDRKPIAMRRTTLLSAAVAIALGATTAQGQVVRDDVVRDDVVRGEAVQGQDAPVHDAPDIPAPKRNAAKLAGLAGFVTLNCDKLRTDQDRFKGAIQSMGVDPAELDRDALMLQARAYLTAYQKDVPGSCRKADELFGPSGRIIPGVFLAR